MEGVLGKCGEGVVSVGWGVLAQVAGVGRVG